MEKTVRLDLTNAEIAELLFERGSDDFAQILRELAVRMEEHYNAERAKNRATGTFRWLCDSYDFSLFVSNEMVFGDKKEIQKRTGHAFDKDPLVQFIESLHGAMWYRRVSKIAEKLEPTLR